MTTGKKSALITGCSEGGIGFAIAAEFQARGLHVFATARSPSKVASSLSALLHVTVLALDVTSQESINAAVTAVAEHTGGTLDYLVNNAGYQAIMPLLDLDMDQVRKMYDVNVFGVIAVTQAFAPLVIEAKGTIANLASIAGLMGPPYMGMWIFPISPCLPRLKGGRQFISPPPHPSIPTVYFIMVPICRESNTRPTASPSILGAYAGSKAACEYISEALRLELKPFGVKVATVITGVVETNIFHNGPVYQLPPDSRYKSLDKEIGLRVSGKEQEGRVGKREDFARSLVGDLIQGASGRVYRGNLSTVMKIVTAYFPTFIMVRNALEKVLNKC